ncbi:MAG: hypothetical protein Q9220_001805 [cf. Caloplaca sp. 1 TL-2023]
MPSTLTSPIEILPCKPPHLPPCLAIYDHYALHTTVTFHTTAQPLSFLASTLATITKLDLPFLVAVDGTKAGAGKEEEVLGYTYATPYRPDRPAYSPTAEITIFLSPLTTGRGIGTLLLSSLLSSLEKRNAAIRPSSSLTQPNNNENKYIDGAIRQLIAVVAMEQDENTAERWRAGRWYLGQGFREVGVMKGVGSKFGREVDVGVFQRGVGAG